MFWFRQVECLFLDNVPSKDSIMYTIKKITIYTPELEQTVTDLLQQLVDRKIDVTTSLLEELLRSDNSHLFCALDREGSCIGMITIGIYLSPTGRKAWIEDVVVAQKNRGQGVGEGLTKHAVQFAKEQGVGALMLTSNPSRIAANRLYQKLGFEQRKTNVYRMIFRP